VNDIKFMVAYILYLAFSWAVLGYYSNYCRNVEGPNLNALEVPIDPKPEEKQV
jgi:hypothetical protein